MAVDPSVPEITFGPPTAESQSRKNHVNNDHFDLSLGPPKISLAPPKCLWSPYHGNLPLFMQVFFKVILAVNQTVKGHVTFDLEV